MGKILLTIQHGNNLFSPPIKGEVTIEWERTGSPGKMKFTTVKSTTEDMSFLEGDAVCFYYDDKPVFMGYVFKKTRDREHHIEVTCYDQLRYLKNKYTYVFENKSASQIITALCKDFNLNVGTMDNTGYTIPAIAEDNKSALDIILDVVEETLMNTKKMFVVYDDFGKITLKNCANMVSDVVIMDTTAENFDYTSSIDNETYNNIVLYYKTDDNQVQVYTAYSPTTIQKWGKLRYFEEVDTPTNGQNKAEQLLRLYNRKTRELKVSGAFGDSAIRGGTLIPVKLNLGDVVTSNYMLVDKVTHTFDNDVHLMDLTLQGYWDDGEYDVKSETIGTIVKKVEASTENTKNTGNTGNTPKDKTSSMANAIVQSIKSGLSMVGGESPQVDNSKQVTISFSASNFQHEVFKSGGFVFSISAPYAYVGGSKKYESRLTEIKFYKTKTGTTTLISNQPSIKVKQGSIVKLYAIGDSHYNLTINTRATEKKTEYQSGKVHEYCWTITVDNDKVVTITPNYVPKTNLMV